MMQMHRFSESATAYNTFSHLPLLRKSPRAHGILRCAAGIELLQENGLLESCCPLLGSCCALLEPSCCRKLGCWNPAVPCWNPAVRCWNRVAAGKWAAVILLSLAGIRLCAAGIELLQENGLLESCCPLLESCCALLEPSCCIKMGRWNLTPFGLLGI